MNKNIFEVVNTIGTSSFSGLIIAILFHIVLIASIILFFISIAQHLSEHKVIEMAIAKAKKDIIEQDKLKNEEYRRQFELEGTIDEKKQKDHYRRISKLLADSGIKQRIPGITPITFMIFLTLIAITVTIIGAVTTKNVVSTIVCFIVTFVVAKFYLELQISRNYKQLEKEAVKFINLLRNNSHIEGSLGEMFGRTIPYISGGLKLSVEKFYYEVKSTGDINASLEHLCERTSYRKLREFFEAIKICSSHNEDYELVIEEASASLSSFISYRQEIAEIKKSNLIDILIITGAGVIMLVEIKGMLTDIDVVYYITKTLIGQAICIAMAILTLTGIYQLIKSDES